MKENPKYIKSGRGERQHLFCPRDIQAVFIIYHDASQHFYISQTKDLSIALMSNFNKLKRNKSPFKKLQDFFNLNKYEDFSFNYVEIEDWQERADIVRLMKEKYHESKLLLNEIPKCEFCNVSSIFEKIVTTNRFGSERSFCGTHYYQMVRQGEIKRTNRWGNEITERNDYLEVTLYDKNQNISGTTKVSKQHRELIEKYKWYRKVHPNRYTDYVIATDENGKRVRLHVLIAEKILGERSSGMSVDHKNRDGLDNRDNNLSYKDQTFQNYNQRISKRNKSGVKGVSKNGNYWAAQIRYKNIKLHKTYKRFEDAVAQRKHWELLLENNRIDLLGKELGK